MNADIVKELRWLSENDEWVFAAETMAKAAALIESLQAQLKLEHGGALAAAENCLRLQGEVNDLQTQLAAEKRRAENAIARIKVFDEMGWFCRWRDGGACTINGKREICRKGTVAATKNPCHDWEWRGDAEEGAER